MAQKTMFRNRAHEVSRLEAFSDVIFGFAISLLVVSLEAPKSYGELMEMMRGMLPFAVCFFVFIDIWFEHHHFFRRYALQDTPTIAINTVLLFVVLFYVYPMRFVLTAAIRAFTG
ncbi:MAG: TMEM175 family protein, partial [Acidobacteriota bacterium]